MYRVSEINRLEELVAEKQKRIDELLEERQRILDARPAPLKAGWAMPEKPKCPKCGRPVDAVAYNDCGETSFWWAGECECGRSLNFNATAWRKAFDEWPFAVDIVYPSDLERAGFRVE